MMEPGKPAKVTRIKRLFATGSDTPVKIRQDDNDSGNQAETKAQPGQAEKEISSHNQPGKD